MLIYNFRTFNSSDVRGWLLFFWNYCYTCVHISPSFQFYLFLYSIILVLVSGMDKISKFSLLLYKNYLCIPCCHEDLILLICKFNFVCINKISSNFAVSVLIIVCYVIQKTPPATDDRRKSVTPTKKSHKGPKGKFCHFKYFSMCST